MYSTTGKNKISVVVPVYKAKLHIEKCILSLVKQTYSNIEVICVIDGPDRECEEILERMTIEYDNIRLIRQQNHGANYSRMIGYQNSMGDYIMFVDSDDWLDENCIQNCADQANLHEADIVKFGYKNVVGTRVIKENKVIDKNTIIQDNTKVSKYIINEIFKGYDFNFMWGQLIKKDILSSDYFNYQLTVAEDLIFNYYMIPNINTLVLINECYYFYYRNDLSVTLNINLEKLDKHINDVTYVYKEILTSLNSKELRDEYYIYIYKELIFYYYKCIRIKNQSIKKNVQYIKNKTNDTFYRDIKSKIDPEKIKNMHNGYKKVIYSLYCGKLFKSVCIAKIIDILFYLKNKLEILR